MKLSSNLFLNWVLAATYIFRNLLFSTDVLCLFDNGGIALSTLLGQMHSQNKTIFWWVEVVNTTGTRVGWLPRLEARDKKDKGLWYY